MPSLIETAAFAAFHRQPSGGRRAKSGGGGSIFKMFKLLPMLSSGCKMVALLGRPSKALLADHATTVTIFGYRRGRASLAIQEDTRSPPIFLIELPVLTSFLYKEMDSGVVKLALESETRTNRRKLVEEYVWAVYCNGRKSGYSIRRKPSSDDDRHVMQLLRGVSMGAGVLPGASEKETTSSSLDGELTYMRARFERVVGSKDSEALYMINPDTGSGSGSGGGGGGPELSIFLVRKK
ncbi:protein MIZU-KUSSEI 1-like [Typha angustifolia]|uniref:protein MIZU-KUSSEI 1-like n=1 Tax=Typha angustifolia TaxID=59011 RepID=UPI003C2F9F68